MPGSMPEGKQFVKDFLLKHSIKRILDIGPGSGNYFDLVTKRGEYAEYPGPAVVGINWTAVEIFEDYIDIFNLRNKYNNIIVCDIFDLDWSSLGHFDVVILGDVLEHMEETRGREVIRKAVDHAEWVILSLPIVDYPQGESWGNKYEAHVMQYYPETVREILKDYLVVDYKEGDIIGTYIFTKRKELL